MATSYAPAEVSSCETQARHSVRLNQHDEATQEVDSPDSGEMRQRGEPNMQAEECRDKATEDEILVCEAINVTSFHTNQQSLLARDSHILMVQEHAVADKQAAAVKNICADEKWNAELGPVDPEHARPTGSVGILAKMPRRCIPTKAKTEAYRDALQTGRLAAYEMDLTCGGVARTLMIIFDHGDLWVDGSRSWKCGMRQD